MRWLIGFQSSPNPCGPGVSRFSLPRETEEVSILAQPLRAGRPMSRGWRMPDQRMFQSSPNPCGPGVYFKKTLFHARQVSILAQPLRAGRPAFEHRGYPATSGFNPRPTLAGRASPSSAPSCATAFTSFNPRPTLAGRASINLGQLVRVRDVSILAQPLRAGRQFARSGLICIAQIPLLRGYMARYAIRTRYDSALSKVRMQKQ